MAALTVADALALTQSLLNDSAGDVFTLTKVLPYMNTAFQWVQRSLAVRGTGPTIDRTTKDLAAAQTELTTSSSPALPTDFIVPLELWEKVTGATDDTYIQMTKVDDLPDRAQGATNDVWAFEEGAIKFIGALGTMTVKIKYEKQLTRLTNAGSGTDSLVIPNIEDALAHKTASLCARSKGDYAMADRLQADAQVLLSELANQFVRVNQRTGRRRRGYAQ